MNELMKQNLKASPILFFDGVCGLCNSAVDFVMAKDRQELFKFSPLQSNLAKKKLPRPLTEDLQSLVLMIDDQIYTKSEAVIKVGQALGGLWAIAVVGYVIPAFLRDRMYDFVAQNRYRWFGQKESCRMPTPNERQRFILE
jgi:predicted DCC family thiol-disulfide oxidoreductase YuxK